MYASGAYSISSASSDRIMPVLSAYRWSPEKKVTPPKLTRTSLSPMPSPAAPTGIAAIAADWPGVHGFHDLKTRMAGSRIFVQIHIELDGSQPLRDAHAIGAGLRRAILEAYPQADVIVHKDVTATPEPQPAEK